MKRNFKVWLSAFSLALMAGISASPSMLTAIASEQSSRIATIGKPAPSFRLTDTNGKQRSLTDAAGKYLVLEWNNFDCPFVRKHYKSSNMQRLQKTYTSKGVLWYTVCSSAAGKQGNYTSGRLNELIKQNNAHPTAYLLDENGKTGKAYGASATPHMFIVSPKGLLIYSGALDDNPSADIADIKTATNYVQKSLDEALAGKPVSTPTSQPYGCSVKYRQ